LKPRYVRSELKKNNNGEKKNGSAPKTQDKKSGHPMYRMAN
jgi:hypothetical protein